jgi:uncharacterized protein (DUF1810 family)
MSRNAFRLARFLDAQENSYADALGELRSGKKRSHWIWYIFPQLKGLGLSANAEFYGLTGLDEARAYLADPLLSPRLKEAIEVTLANPFLSAASILGELDALKFRSCLTLFSLADPSEPLFSTALERFFGGEHDARTIELINNNST